MADCATAWWLLDGASVGWWLLRCVGCAGDVHNVQGRPGIGCVCLCSMYMGVGAVVYCCVMMDRTAHEDGRYVVLYCSKLSWQCG